MRTGWSSSSNGRYRNPCLTMHQPWASLLVHGIKRIEGRSWPSPVTGRLWIHAASKVPDPETIKAMEDFYREIYAVNGITDIKFPDHYPVSRLLGCVEVVGCVRSQELVCWEDVPESVRLEGLTDFCWLCENPQKLVVPFEMRGYQGVYNLERRIYDGAVRGLSPVQGPLPVKFPLPDPRDPFSLKPGSLVFSTSKSAVQKGPNLTAAVAGARAAATQFSKKDHNGAASSENGTREQSRGNRTGSSSGNTILSPNVQTSPSYMQNQSQPSSVQRSSANLQIQSLPSFVESSRTYSQNQNQPSIVERAPAYLLNPNTEVRRSPRLQSGASSRVDGCVLNKRRCIVTTTSLSGVRTDSCFPGSKRIGQTLWVWRKSMSSDGMEETKKMLGGVRRQGLSTSPLSSLLPGEERGRFMHPHHHLHTATTTRMRKAMRSLSFSGLSLPPMHAWLS